MMARFKSIKMFPFYLIGSLFFYNLLFLHPIFAQSSSSTKGITIITHGYSSFSTLSDEWLNLAKAIRKRAGGGNIFMNHPQTGVWNSIDGFNSNNSKDEIIFLYNWAWASDNLHEGYLQASVEHLFALLMNPPQALNMSSEALFQKPIHLIGHSRGAILLNMLAHQIGFYLPDVAIEQFTLLDAHPAVAMNDCQVAGIVGDCPPDKNYFEDDIYLVLPQNIQRADNYFRQDGLYEDIFSYKTFGAYDGIAVKGLGKWNGKLNDSTLTLGSTKLGGSHAILATRWYYGTVDWENIYQHSIHPSWYEADKKHTAMHPRHQTGYYFTRLGGGQLPDLIAKNDKMPIIQPKQYIFNGDFGIQRVVWKGLIPAWDNNGGGGSAKIMKADDSQNFFLRLELPKVNFLGGKINERTHSFVYIPPNIQGDDFCLKLKFRCANEVKGQNYLVVSMIKASNQEEIQVGEFISIQNKSNDFQEICLAIPTDCKGQTCAIRLALEGEKNNRIVDVDDVDWVKIR
jgi:hypothetical protein